MRQKPLQWLLSRIVANGGRKQPLITTSRVSQIKPQVRRWSAGYDVVPLPWDFASRRAFAAPAIARTEDKEKAPNPGGGDRKINRAITARMVRLVSDEGHEILSRYDALNRAQQAGLDLVEVDGRADPPVCKLMDFTKERFKVKKQEKDMKKKQLERRRLDDLKEVRFSSRTEQKDLEMKAETASRLLARGHRVKLAVQFHGNDKGDEVGVELLERAMALLQTEMKVDSGPRVEKMRAWVMIRPVVEQKTSKKKASKSIAHETDSVE